MFSDITALRELERAREEFLSSAAHDLKTPLTSIRGQAQLAQRRLARLDTPETAPVLVQLARIQEGTDAMVGLIDELVDVTRQRTTQARRRAGSCRDMAYSRGSASGVEKDRAVVAQCAGGADERE
jgi:signal transduction histidine kinase